jgi:hypothetical protein
MLLYSKHCRVNYSTLMLNLQQGTGIRTGEWIGTFYSFHRAYMQCSPGLYPVKFKLQANPYMWRYFCVRMDGWMDGWPLSTDVVFGSVPYWGPWQHSVQTFASQFMQIPFRSFHITHMCTHYIPTNNSAGWMGGGAGSVGRLVRMQEVLLFHNPFHFTCHGSQTTYSPPGGVLRRQKQKVF